MKHIDFRVETKGHEVSLHILKQSREILRVGKVVALDRKRCDVVAKDGRINGSEIVRRVHGSISGRTFAIIAKGHPRLRVASFELPDSLPQRRAQDKQVASATRPACAAVLYKGKPRLWRMTDSSKSCLCSNTRRL